MFNDRYPLHLLCGGTAEAERWTRQILRCSLRDAERDGLALAVATVGDLPDDLGLLARPIAHYVGGEVDPGVWRAVHDVENHWRCTVQQPPARSSGTR